MRPCFLVIDPEHASSISTRKLVLETAKYNVVTAYSCDEAGETLARFPAVHGVVLNGEMRDKGKDALLRSLERFPEVKLIVVGDPISTDDVRVPDATVASFAPSELLTVLAELFPRQTGELRAREENLERRQN